MKKLILIALLFTIGSHSQNTTIHFYYAPIEKTSGAEVLTPVGDIWLGGGFSGAWDVQNNRKERWCSIYTTASFGYLNSVLVKYKAGLCTFTEGQNRETVTYQPMIGISGMYAVSKDYGIEVGYDTFNKVSLGFTVIF